MTNGPCITVIGASTTCTATDEKIAEDVGHSDEEKRYYCFGVVAGGILTVRFTYRGNSIRIIGAGYWRKGKKLYEDKNQIHG